jgi:uracil-DNA glycosylase family 4
MRSLNSLSQILQAVKNCKKCKLYKFRDKCVFAEGKDDAKTILIGLSPGKEENSTGKLFVGPSGDFLNELLRLAKIERSSLYITNIIKCHAPTYSIGKEEVAACSAYLDRQIEIIRPEIIIPLGSIATQYILEKYKLPKEKIGEAHGKLLQVGVGDLFSPLRDIKIIPMFHPAAALRTPALAESIKQDWQKLNKRL